MSEVRDSNNSIFTPEELELMELTKSVRVDSIKELVKDGPPVKTNELRVLNELASSLDKQVTDNANNRLKHEATASADTVLDMVASTLKNISSLPTVAAVTATELPNSMLPDDIVPGEAEIVSDILSAADYMSEEDN